MEQWKLPELRQSVGYQLEDQGGDRCQPSAGLSHAPTPTPTPNSSGKSGVNRNANASSLTRFDKLNNSLRLIRIKNIHQIIKSRLQARLDNQESKNRVLATRRDRLKQDEQLLASLKAMKDKIVAAEYQERQLEKEVKVLDSAIWKYDMKGLLEEAWKEQGEKKENEDENEEGEVDDGESEEEEVDVTENSEQDSGEEEEEESNCPDDEDDY